jgi:hypothetical protein
LIATVCSSNSSSSAAATFAHVASRAGQKLTRHARALFSDQFLLTLALKRAARH